MADALLGIVFQDLQSVVQSQLATYWGIDQQAQKLSSNLTAIRAVLRDAERKQIASHAVKDWLQKLTDAAYVLDDILDECSIHSREVLSDDGHTSCLARAHPKDILFRFHIGKRMKNITQRFHDINEERRMFELRVGVTEKPTVDDGEDYQTTSVITEPIFCGRDEDREKVVKLLLEANNNEDLTIYSIVGMGGLGKTTLAKHVFHDHRVCENFDLTIWVYVSVDFNVKAILQSIIEYATGQNPNLHTLETMRKKVEEVLHSKRYLLVLDDVWNEDQEKWKHLEGMLRFARGAKGATVLVTTRLEEVASTMETHPAYHLTELSVDDSWSLFKSYAFGPNREEKKELVAIGKDIVKKCVGSPLAIKTLGSLLRDQTAVTQWENIKESEIWDIRSESSSMTGKENSIMRALKLSYFNLELSLRRCFSFCAIFPKGFEIVKEELIHLWMANGFIKSEGNVEVEDIANNVWRKLYRRSFFQEAKSDKFGMITSCKIHDLFYDLAKSIMGEECVMVEEGRLTQLSTRVHHLHFLSYNMSVDVAAFKKVESMRTFLFGNIRQLPSNRCLRALCIRSSMLPPLNDLAHLRYLSVHDSSVRNLNDSICQLSKLQILKLESCFDFYEIPKKLTQLQDLRHILINKCASIPDMPPNIGKLRHLRTLSLFDAGSTPGYGLTELSGLRLGGKLHIRGLGNVSNEWEAKEANLRSKKELNRLYLSWGGGAISEGNNVSAERVLEALEPPSTLKGFGMEGYQGRKLPSWMRSVVVLKDLVEIILFDCNNCEELPPLGKLPHLKKVHVRGMKNVKWIDGESYEGVEEKAFPSLSVENLPKLERMLRDEGVEMVPHLSQLTIDGVFNFKVPHLPCVEELHARRVVAATSFIEGVGDNMVCLKTLGVSLIKGVKVLPDQLRRLGALEYLHIGFWYDLEHFPEHVSEGLTSLRSLSISNWNLKSLPEGVRHLTCLRRLSIRNCPELVALPSNISKLTSLLDVSIDYCPTLPYGLQRVPSLRTLDIIFCKCTSLPDWLGDMTSLQELFILDCGELRSLPSSIQRLTNLSYLSIHGCPHLRKRCKRETGDDWQYINHIPEIELDSYSLPEEKSLTLSGVIACREYPPIILLMELLQDCKTACQRSGKQQFI
ncbi:putative disease resistance protein RGA4 isoform X2 [Vigna angularis]|uniref:putative disease resistance protein RGA4 isoform X2 n=1 Tax=Phaseolus angularis TaxID=3914 RepID=UPI0022B3F0EF|nr:putative disease resistance protein RGA4 isoform X2 [Vigna angularis]